VRRSYIANRVALVSILALSTVAFGSVTIATFADPAANGTTPLFALAGNQFTGGWAGTGLTLETPGISPPDFPNAKFTMTPLTANMISPGFYTLNGGTITFTDAANAPVMLITFQAASLATNIGFGASDLGLQNVVFTVPGIPETFTDERFAFSFANDVVTPNGTTWTSSFTSSAVVVPEPAGLLSLGMGALLLLTRRR
jgi:hypothetical protein